MKENRSNLTQEKPSPTYQFACEALSPELLQELGGPVRSNSLVEGGRVEHSGKMKTLDKLLSTFSASMEKVIVGRDPVSVVTFLFFQTLVFSYSTQTLSVIEAYVQARGWRYR